MKTLPQSWPFATKRVEDDDQRAATLGSVPFKRTQGVDVLGCLATGRRRPPTPRLDSFDAPY